MNKLTRHYLLCGVIAALGFFGGTAWAQNAPATPPKPAAPATAPKSTAPAQPAAPAAADTDQTQNDDGPRAADDTSDADPPIVWTRDRARPRGARFRSSDDDDIVSIGGDSTFSGGRRIDSVVSVFGSSTSTGDVRDAVVSVFGNTRVEGGSVGDSAVSVVGNNYVNAVVDGDVVAVLGDVELGPQANVRGDVVVVGGRLIRDPAAQVRGNVQHVLSIPPGTLKGVRSWLENCARYLRPLAFADGLGWAWTLALGILALYALFAVLFRDPLDRCVRTLQERPGQTIVASLLTMLLMPIVSAILMFTVIGFPLVVFASMIATMFGKAVVLAWMGHGVLKVANREDRSHSAIAVLIGGAIILLLYTVPVLGFMVFNVLGILALGVVVYTLLLAWRGKRATTPPSSGSRASGAGPAPAAPTSPAAAGGEALAGAAPYTAGFSADSISPDSSGAAAAGTATGAATGSPESGSFAGPGFASGSGAGGGTSGGAGATVPPATNGVADALSLPRAGFWIRMLALLIDGVIIGAAFSVLDHHSRLQLVAIATYGAIMWKLKGTTVGGIVCNLKIVRIDGREIDWSTAIVRALGCFLSLVVCGLGFIWIAFDPGRQAWHDKIAGTAVVRVPQGVSLL